MDDEYEILSNGKLEKLNNDAEDHKSKPFIKNSGDANLHDSIIELTKALNKMAGVFNDVKQKLIHEEQSGEGPDAKLEKLLSQNKSIAQALVSFGEKLDNLSFDSLGSNEISEVEDDVEEPKAPEQFEEPPISNAPDPEMTADPVESPEIPTFYESIQEPVQQQPSPENFSETAPPENTSAEMDFQSWNYGEHSKPGVSHSSYTAPSTSNSNTSFRNRRLSSQRDEINRQFSQPQQDFGGSQSQQDFGRSQSQQGFDNVQSQQDFGRSQSQQGFGGSQPPMQASNQQFSDLSQPNFDRPAQQEQQFSQDFSAQDASNDDFFQRGFDESIQNKKFDIEKKPEYAQSLKSDGVPELKPIEHQPPRKKKRFGLF